MNNDELLNQIQLLSSLFSPTKLFTMLVCIGLLWAINTGMRRLSDWCMSQFPGHRFLILQIATLLSFIIYIGGTVVVIIGVLQPPREFILAIGGSAAVAFGFAVKDIAASLISGLVLLFDRPFQVGDRVSFDNVYGEIVSIGLRSVRLRTLDDNIVTIPNSRFINDVASSGNTGAMDMMVVADFHLGLEADIQRAQELVRQVIVTSRYTYLKKPVVFTLEEVEIGQRIALRLRAKAYVLDVNYEKAMQTDIVKRASELFREHAMPRPI